MRTQQIIYWIATGFLSVLFLLMAGMCLLYVEMVQEIFKGFNYPSYLVIPLGLSNIFAVVMILWRRSKWLTEWAYAGLFFNLIIAFSGHYNAKEDVIIPILGIVLLLISYFLGKDVRH